MRLTALQRVGGGGYCAALLPVSCRTRAWYDGADEAGDVQLNVREVPRDAPSPSPLQRQSRLACRRFFARLSFDEAAQRVSGQAPRESRAPAK